MFWTRADGAGQPQQLTQSKGFQIPASFSPDGKRLAYHDFTSSNGQIWTVPVDDNGRQLRAGKPEQFLKSQFEDSFAAFSPDGRWLAYASNESGRDEVYVRAFPVPAAGQGGKTQISNSGGIAPVWSRNGSELLYYAGDQIMTVSYSVRGDTFLADKPRAWAENATVRQAREAVDCDNCFDLSPDGKRVAVLTPVEQEPPTEEHEVVFLFNFFDELQRRVPAEK